MNPCLSLSPSFLFSFSPYLYLHAKFVCFHFFYFPSLSPFLLSFIFLSTYLSVFIKKAVNTVITMNVLSTAMPRIHHQSAYILIRRMLIAFDSTKNTKRRNLSVNIKVLLIISRKYCMCA